MSFYEIGENYFSFIKIKLKNSTYQNNKKKIELYVINPNKDKNIYEFDTRDFIEWEIFIERFGFSYNYKSSLFYLFKEFLDYCINFYNLKENVAIKIGNFRNDEITKSGNIWSYDDFKKFISVVDNKIYNCLFELLYFTGLRKGEALALTFNDIDFKEKKLHINKTITRHLDSNNNKIITSPKTRSSNRIISLDDKLIKEIKELQKEYDNFNNDMFIFGGNNSMSFTTLERKKNYYCKLAKVKQIKIHEFRHSHACLLFKNKIEIEDISYRLGHSSISMTMDTYLKYLPKNEKRVISTLNQLRLN